MQQRGMWVIRMAVKRAACPVCGVGGGKRNELSGCIRRSATCGCSGGGVEEGKIWGRTGAQCGVATIER